MKEFLILTDHWDCTFEWSVHLPGVS